MAGTAVVYPSKDVSITNVSWGGYYMFQTGQMNYTMMGNWDFPGMPYRGLYAYQSRVLMQYNLPVLPAGAVITAVNFKPYFLRADMMHSWNDGLYSYNANPIIDVHRMTQAWDEGTGDGNHDGYQYSGATWTNRTSGGWGWSSWGGSYDTNASASKQIAYGWGEQIFDLKSLVQYWYSNPSQNFGLILKYRNDNSPQGCLQMTSRQGNVYAAPPLEIIYSTPPEKPRGLSPNFDSTISPQIPGSMILRWNFLDTTDGNPWNDEGDWQSQATVTVYKVNGDGSRSTVGSWTVSGSQNWFDISGVAFQDGAGYEWEVTTWDSTGLASPVSSRARFRYHILASYPGLPTWGALPAAGNTVGPTYLTEIKNNLRNEVTKYSGLDASQVDALFTNGIIPSKTDYQSLGKIIGSIYAKHGRSYTNGDLVGNTFGISDMTNMRNMISDLANLVPNAPTSANSNVTIGSLTAPASITATHTSAYDSAMQVSWGASTFLSSGLNLTLIPSSDGNAYYYKVHYEQHWANRTYNFDLYFTPDQIASTITLPLNEPFDWHSMYYYAIDKNNRISGALGVPLNGGTNYANPYYVGVSRYIVECQVKYWYATESDPNGNWFKVYEGPAGNFTHWVSGQASYWYRVKAIDWNGNQTGYTYSTNQVYIRS